jgi:molybdopterin converting factor small subunit
MHVQVEFISSFSKCIDPTQHTRLLLKEELRPGASLRTLLSQLADRYKGFAERIYDTQNDRLHAHVLVTHNGRLVTSLTNLDLMLHDGDSVGFIPQPIGG